MLKGGGDVWDMRDPHCRRRALVFNDHVAKIFSDRVAIKMPLLGLTLTVHRKEGPADCYTS